MKTVTRDAASTQDAAAVERATPPLIVTPTDENPNTEGYWDERFASGDWEAHAGRSQTAQFAQGQIPHFRIPSDFEGSILDFGCGLGDGVPIYHQAFPKARMRGMDISQAAVDKCRQRYGDIAEFEQGIATDVADVDVIIASNVFEHLSHDRDIARALLSRCKELYIVVPYAERLRPGGEHVNSYTESYFDDVAPSETTVFHCPGWTQEGWDLWWNIHLKNVIRPLVGKPTVRRGKQIMFRFTPGA